MAVAKRPKQKPSRSDNRKVTKSPPVSDEFAKEKKKKKKKDKQSKELIISRIGEDGEKRIRMTKKRMKQLAELTGDFKDDLPSIFELIDDPNASADDIQRAYLRAAFSTIVGLIPTMEDQALKKKNESGAYALNALLSQGREIAADLRALQSSDEIAIRIASMVIDPIFISIMSVLLQAMASLRDEVERLASPGNETKIRQLFQTAGITIGQHLDVSKASMKSRIEEMIE